MRTSISTLLFVLFAQSCATTSHTETPADVELTKACARGLQQELVMWRLDVCYARSGKYPEMKVSEVEARRITVHVTSTADMSALTCAGLSGAGNNGQTVSGIIALRDVERLAGLPAVSSIAMEPHVEPH